MQFKKILSAVLVAATVVTMSGVKNKSVNALAATKTVTLTYFYPSDNSYKVQFQGNKRGLGSVESIKSSDKSVVSATPIDDGGVPYAKIKIKKPGKATLTARVHRQDGGLGIEKRIIVVKDSTKAVRFGPVEETTELLDNGDDWGMHRAYMPVYNASSYSFATVQVSYILKNTDDVKIASGKTTVPLLGAKQMGYAIIDYENDDDISARYSEFKVSKVTQPWHGGHKYQAATEGTDYTVSSNGASANEDIIYTFKIKKIDRKHDANIYLCNYVFFLNKNGSVATVERIYDMAWGLGSHYKSTKFLHDHSETALDDFSGKIKRFTTAVRYTVYRW